MKRSMPWLVTIASAAVWFVGPAVNPAWAGGPALDHHTDRARNLLYFETNNASHGQNAVVAYRRNSHDGTLTPLGVYMTHGTGFMNADQRLGVDDTDQEVIASRDGRLLFAVNAGSDDISVFHIRDNGSLKLVKNAPFHSRGKQPSSLVLVGDLLYVVNRGDGILPTMTEHGKHGTPGATNYTGFEVEEDGRLEPIADSTIRLKDGSSPSQIVGSQDHEVLFADNFFHPDDTVTPPAPIFPAARSLLNSLKMTSEFGALSSGPSVQLPPQFDAAPYILGLRLHPNRNILYGGLVAVGRLGVWKYDDTDLDFVGIESDPNNIGPGAGLCWIAIDPAVRFLYTSNIVGDVIGVLSIEHPAHPVRIQNLVLGGPKSPLLGGNPEPYQNTTAPFNLAVAPDGKFVYVLTNQTCTLGTMSLNPDCASGTAIHTLKIHHDGTVSETAASPLVLPQSVVPYHAKGIVVR